MKNIGPILCIFTLLCLHIAATGNIRRETNGLRAGDSFALTPVTYTDTLYSGENKIWDLSGAKPCGKPRRVTLTRSGEKDDSLCCVVGNTAYHFLCRGDSVIMLAFENNLSDMVYPTGEALLLFPIDFNSEFAGHFSGSGRYADKWRHEMSGSYRTGADARGRLVTADGDTINNVIRIRTVRVISSHYLASDSAMADSLNLMQRDSRLYAPGYRYPLVIASALLTADGAAEISRKAWYIPPYSLEELDDPDNSELRKEEESPRSGPWQYGPGHGTEAEEEEHRNVNYTFSQDKGSGTVTVEFSVAQPTDVELVLSDISGIIYRRELTHANPGESYSIVLDYSGLPLSAAYGVGINGGTEHYSEKFYR